SRAKLRGGGGFELTSNQQHPPSLLPFLSLRWLHGLSLRLELEPRLKLEHQQRSSKPQTTAFIESTSGRTTDELSTKFLLLGSDGSSIRESTRREAISRRPWRIEEISRKEQPGGNELDLPWRSREEGRREEDQEELAVGQEGRRHQEEEEVGVGRLSFLSSRLGTLWEFQSL
ncbi:hypothetical protein BDY24DRAFT_442675, partial [Mrakia frigida]|uniref:uncharacterized protein n=1 Tax=Mrakia frigida TaxID=29902 RepID=UPI003FCBF25F